MTGLVSVVLLGLFLGIRHATDPDHVIAVTTIVSRHRSMSGAALIGAAWGVGHTLTIVAVGAGILLLGWTISPGMELSMELVVAAMLILLGLANLRGARFWLAAARTADTPEDVRVQPHRHGDYVHTHPHTPADHPHRADATPLAWLDRRLGTLRLYQLSRPLTVGVVHGLAGSAAATLLVLTIIDDPGWAVAYLGLFGFGTVAGMMLFTSVLAAPLAWAPERWRHLHGHVRLGSSVLSIGFGLFLAYQVGGALMH